jgi:hypothetical protein
MIYEDVKDAALALSREEQLRLHYDLQGALGYFTMSSLYLDCLIEDLNEGYFEADGVPAYSVSKDDAYGAIEYVARKANGPEEYTPYLYEWAARNLIEDGCCPRLVPMWSAGLGG